MTDLVEFLRARLDEDERIARARIEGSDWMDFERCKDIHHPHADYLPHFNPYRVLAEVEAKRRIIDLHGESKYITNRYDCNICTDNGVTNDQDSGETFAEPEAWPCRTIRLLALPYSDHPDYQQEWRP